MKRQPKPHTIQCSLCGRPRSTVRKNTVYCHPCRLLKSVMAIGERTKVSWVTEKPFAPTSMHEVAELEHLPRSFYNIDGECIWCHEAGVLYSDDVLVCQSCINDPARRPALVRALMKKQQDYIAQQKEEAPCDPSASDATPS